MLHNATRLIDETYNIVLLYALVRFIGKVERLSPRYKNTTLGRNEVLPCSDATVMMNLFFSCHKNTT